VTYSLWGRLGLKGYGSNFFRLGFATRTTRRKNFDEKGRGLGLRPRLRWTALTPFARMLVTLPPARRTAPDCTAPCGPGFCGTSETAIAPHTPTPLC